MSHCIFMHFQFFTGRESSVAVMAVEGFLLSVASFMHFQIFTGRKSCIAINAVEGFLSSVGSFMHFQTSLDAKAPLKSCQFKDSSLLWVLS